MNFKKTGRRKTVADGKKQPLFHPRLTPDEVLEHTPSARKASQRRKRATHSCHVPIRRGIRERLFLSSLSSFRRSLTISIKAAPFYIKASPFYIKGVRFYKNPLSPPLAVKRIGAHSFGEKKRIKSIFIRCKANEKKASEPTFACQPR